MGFTSFSGRVLFSAIFILAAYQKINEFGTDGGSSMKQLQPKFAILKKNFVQATGLSVPEFELKQLLLTAIALEGLGGILFIFGSTFGAYLLIVFLAAVTPVMHDFYNYDLGTPEYNRELINFLKNLSMFGALLFFVGMKNSSSKKMKKKPVKTKAN